ncbi:TfoX/Sxy family DNA transformation protein [Vibrio barjaei]|uniref:TfoX/Sxy family DNA transformation protein n=1 Tax=Vibrio barjaei TaxID=1676683 RepID=UPI0022837852|nr:TfoX/Sxy family DNA transformation protein [Vibrio barjaei]MCY9872378.1 TfoX/Sxy family DNA transformation protein [Vibrio barjaei]
MQQTNFKSLDDVYSFFAKHGEVNLKTMFGAYGIFVDTYMVALLNDSTLYVRSCEETDKYIGHPEYKKYAYVKGISEVQTNFHTIPSELLQNEDTAYVIGKAIFEAAKIAKCEKIASMKDPKRLRDLPNMKLSTERLLKKSGINGVADLHSLGTVDAFKRIQQVNKSATMTLAYSLEGAIQGVHWSVISQERRAEIQQMVAI